MNKHTNQHPKQAKQEKKAKREKREKELLELLCSLSSIKDDVELALEGFREDWPEARVCKFDNIMQMKVLSVLDTLRIAFEETDAVLSDLSESAPEAVRESFAAQEDEALQVVENEAVNPDSIFEAQSRMRDSIMEILKGPHPAVAACNAACGAAETVFLVGMGMAQRTRAVACAIAEDFPDHPSMLELKQFLASEAQEAYDFSADMITAVYKDTCMEAIETCKALVEGPESIRRGQTLQ